MHGIIVYVTKLYYMKRKKTKIDEMNYILYIIPSNIYPE